MRRGHAATARDTRSGFARSPSGSPQQPLSRVRVARHGGCATLYAVIMQLCRRRCVTRAPPPSPPSLVQRWRPLPLLLPRTLQTQHELWSGYRFYATLATPMPRAAIGVPTRNAPPPPRWWQPYGAEANFISRLAIKKKRDRKKSEGMGWGSNPHPPGSCICSGGGQKTGFNASKTLCGHVLISKASR